MSSSEPPQPKRRSLVNSSQPSLAVQSAIGVPSPVPAVQPELPPVKGETLMTGDAKVATHPQSMVGPAPAPQFQTLGRYTVIGELGRGGMGVVYLADDTVLKRKVALKIPQFEPDKADQMQARFVREAQMAAQLSHINICQIYDVGVIDGQYVMAMEYIDGKTLSGFTKAGKLISERQAVYFVRKVAIAVEAAHQKGLIHRDLKPGNIMLPKADPVTKVIEPKVMDFGLAKSLEARTTELTKSGMIVGTPCYMSKEQWSGRDAQLGPQCDIYSLGIILYELLTGKLPYDVDDEEPATAWFVKLVTQPQIRPTERKPDVDPALDAIVMRAIAKEAPDRYPSMAEFAKDLDAWLKGKAKPAGQSLVGQLPPGLLPLAPPPVNLLLDLGDIESIKSQPSLTIPTRRKPPGAIPTWAQWAGGAAVFLLGITFWFSIEKKPDGTVEVKGELNTTEAPKETPLDQRPAEQPDGDGWISLFNGTDVSRWSTLGPFSVDNGQLVSTGRRGNAITRNEYSEFELEAEWRIGKGGNSGIYYREPSDATNYVYAGNEFSIADDASFDSSVLTPDRRTGSLYGVIAPSISATKPVGEWNQTRIVCRGTTVEHWLNGGRIVRYDTASNEFRQVIAQSTIKAGKENIGTRQTGRILLQSHTGEVAFRSVRIRELSADSTPTMVDAVSESAGPRTSTDGSEKELGITRLKEALVGYSWNYVDSLYLPGGPIRFYSNGKFHDQWKWNYWVVGPTTMHVQFWDSNYSPSKSVVFMFNKDLTRFTAEFDKHRVTGTRLNAILADSSATDPVAQLVGIQNGDFSDGLNGWQKEGNATDFKVYPGPFMTTHNGVYDARGRLFQTLDVPSDATRLEFFVHGGNSPSMYVALTENGKVLHQATGKNTNDWSPIAWDVSELRGKQVTLEIVDQLVRRAWGHIGAYGFKIVRDTTVNTPPPSAKQTDPQSITNSIGMKLTLIPSGEFLMGSPESEKGRANDEGPQHRVSITKPFYLGVHEVTNGQFADFVNEKNYTTDAERNQKGAYGLTSDGVLVPMSNYSWRNTGFSQTNDHPVVCVSWNDAKAFCDWLGAKEGESYRLPSEAEWEYACRAGTSTEWWHGAEAEGLPKIGNVADGTWKATFNRWPTLAAKDGFVFTAPVGRFQANAFGLYDMHGNAFEWCEDGYEANAYAARSGVTTAPLNTSITGRRVLRGASFLSGASETRSARRYMVVPHIRVDFGFRVLRTQ